MSSINTELECALFLPLFPKVTQAVKIFVFKITKNNLEKLLIQIRNICEVRFESCNILTKNFDLSTTRTAAKFTIQSLLFLRCNDISRSKTHPRKFESIFATISRSSLNNSLQFLTIEDGDHNDNSSAIMAQIYHLPHLNICISPTGSQNSDCEVQ
ncbi:unnamed protein product [Moneuplotes crassus]|uniref:Uncharacterized protein n=1 Tax=Euplotes crassus TaxID=5936 RepID=A0AAD1XUQ7_EUPCR|nr:unnamed protein product [Moneuplotes crassus]